MLTLVLGGARSGKSRHAESIVEAHPSPWLYVATGQAFDDEMRDRIARHRTRRGSDWHTHEIPLDLAEFLATVPAGRPVLVDCATLWLSNTILAGRDVDAECQRLVDVLAQPAGPWVVVANEVGLGIVPQTKLGRDFRDAAGTLNRLIAEKADRVVLTVAGIPVPVK